MINLAVYSEARRFLIREEVHQNTEVDLSKIVGTSHPSYAGGAWESLIFHGKKSNTNLADLAKTPDYYFSEMKGVELTQIDENIFVDGGGNNRTVISKFFFYFNKEKIGHSRIRGVRLTKLFIDWDAFKNFQRIEGFLKKNELTHISIDHSTRFPKKIFIHNSNANCCIHLSYTDLVQVADSLESSCFFKRLFGLGYHKYFRNGPFW